MCFAPCRWRERSFSCCAHDDDPMLESGTYNKFRTGEQGKESVLLRDISTGAPGDGLLTGAHAVVKDGGIPGCLRCRWQCFLLSVQHW